MSHLVQTIIAAIIAASFACTAAELQVLLMYC
jgi:hypothetical protein